MSSVDDPGYKEGQKIITEGAQIAAYIRQAAAIAAAIDNASQLISNYKKQRDIANRSLRIAEEERRHLSDVYWPRELEFLAEFGTPEEVEEADVYGRRFAGHLIAPVAKAFAQAMKKQRCNASRYCTSSFAIGMQALYQAHATAVTNAKIMGYCMGFSYAKARDEANDKRRLQALGLAKNLFGKAAGLYKTAAQGLVGAGANALNGLSGAIATFNAADRISRSSVAPMPDYEPKVDGIKYSPGANGLNYGAFQTNVGAGLDYDINAMYERIGLSAEAAGNKETAEWARTQQVLNTNYSSDFEFDKTPNVGGMMDSPFGKRSLIRVGNAPFTLKDSRGGTVTGTINVGGAPKAYSDGLNDTDLPDASN